MFSSDAPHPARSFAIFSLDRFPTGSNPRPADGMEIVSLALTGLPRPHPFAMELGADAMEVLYCWSVVGAPTV